MAGWNDSIIEEFRTNEGRVGGRFEGIPILLVHHKGAKSGTERVNPLAYQQLDGDAWAIFGSKGGAPTDPDWFHNLKANADAKVEVGTQTFDVKARVAQGEEREQIWEKQKGKHPVFAHYEQKTDREIPVIILERAS